MHCIPLNIMKNLWKTWNSTRINTDKKDHATYTPGSDYIFESTVANIISRILQQSRTNMPARMCWMPGKFDHIRGFKSSEWQDFIEKYGISLLYGRLYSPTHSNLCDLHAILKIATADCITHARIDDLGSCIQICTPISTNLLQRRFRSPYSLLN